MSVITLTHRMQEDMQLRGFAPRTQASYLGAVTGLATFCGRPRDALETMALAPSAPPTAAVRPERVPASGADTAPRPFLDASAGRSGSPA